MSKKLRKLAAVIGETVLTALLVNTLFYGLLVLCYKLLMLPLSIMGGQGPSNAFLTRIEGWHIYVVMYVLVFIRILIDIRKKEDSC